MVAYLLTVIDLRVDRLSMSYRHTSVVHVLLASSISRWSEAADFRWCALYSAGTVHHHVLPRNSICALYVLTGNPYYKY